MKKAFFIISSIFCILYIFSISWATPVQALICEGISYSCFCTTCGFPSLCCSSPCAERPCCSWSGCDCIGCEQYSGYCCNCTSCGTGCFTEEAEIGTIELENSKNSEYLKTKSIKDLEPGDFISSFNPETGEIEKGTVSDIQIYTREGYYELETESGKRIKATAEHPFLAVNSKVSINQVLNLQNQLREILSHTLTYKLITSLQMKINGILK